MADTLASTSHPSIVPLTEADLAGLIKKHREKIDPILSLDPQSQKKAFQDLGIDTKGLENFYSDLAQRDTRLHVEENAANRKTAIAGWASVAAGIGGMYALIRRYPPASKLVKGFAIALSGLGAGLTGLFIGSRVFSGRIREESRQVAVEARQVAERELAIAFENRAMETDALHGLAQKAIKEQATQAQAPAIVVPVANTKIAPREASFTAQAAIDKETAQAKPADLQR